MPSQSLSKNTVRTQEMFFYKNVQNWYVFYGSVKVFFVKAIRSNLDLDP
jgi:hypothetical protein